MQPLIDNARTFGQRPEEFAKLAEGQSPQVPGVWEYPPEKQRLAKGQLRLRAWYYEVHTGSVREHRAATDAFEAL
nr:probable carbonic anhydrase b-CA(2)-2 [Streptomyces sp.]